MKAQPAYFISHGAPTLLTDGSPAHKYLKVLGREIVNQTKPDAIIIMSAHFEKSEPTISAHPAPNILYDFHGFPAGLYKHIYAAPGSAALAKIIHKTLQSADFEPHMDPNRGFDHGTWVPLSLMFPAADIPVVQLSISLKETPQYHYKLGRALAHLRGQNVLIIGSGNLTHNLHEFFTNNFALNALVPHWVGEFANWLGVEISAGHKNRVLNALNLAPHAKRNHPTLDHLHPLFFAMGAGGANLNGQRLHKSVSHGVLAMDVYKFS